MEKWAEIGNKNCAHNARHTFPTISPTNGVDIPTVSKLPRPKGKV